MKFLLDTNVISEIRKRDRANASVAAWVEQTQSRDICTSVIVLAELRRGIELKRRNDPAQAKVFDRWYQQMRLRLGDRVLPVTESIAEEWANLNVPNLMPVADGLIAATARVHGLTLVTRNTGDLRRAGVKVLNPFD